MFTEFFKRMLGHEAEKKAEAKRTLATIIESIVDGLDPGTPEEVAPVLQDYGIDTAGLQLLCEKEAQRREWIKAVEAGDAAAESHRQAQAEIAAANKRYVEADERIKRERFEQVSKWTPVLADSQRLMNEANTARVRLSEMMPGRAALVAESRTIGETVQDANEFERKLRSAAAVVKAAEQQLAAAVSDRAVTVATRKLAAAKQQRDRIQSELDGCRKTVTRHQEKWRELETSATEASVLVQ